MAKKEKIQDRGSKAHKKSGRPRKFEGPTHNFFLTLPLETVALLKTVDDDLGRAVVKLAALTNVESTFPEDSLPSVTSPETLQFLPLEDGNVIVLGSKDLLPPLTGLVWIPLGADMRLMALQPGADLRQIELEIQDYLQTVSEDSPAYPILTTFAELLRTTRKSKNQKLFTLPSFEVPGAQSS
ncbi:MAG: hypothetical protein WCA07_07015 [Gloeobacterales cyanobacterium]